MKPHFELNKENLMMMIKTFSKGHPDTLFFPVNFCNIFNKDEDSIRKVMEELVEDGSLEKECADTEKYLGKKAANHFGNVAYRVKQ